MRASLERDGEHFKNQQFNFGASIVVGVEIRGEKSRLFNGYASSKALSRLNRTL